VALDPQKNTFDYHRKHPEVSLEKYFRSKAIETADRVLARKAIYLDTRYWVALRDVRLGRARTTLDEELLNTLTTLVDNGKVVCPINANILAELLKQEDEATRLTTARLIEELSQGIALQPEDERIGTELAHCIQLSLRGPDALEPLKRLVWTSVSYTLGCVFPTVDSLPPAEMLACQKAFTDHLWDIPFSDQISMLGDPPKYLTDRWGLIAEKINRETQKHGGTPRSFKEVHLHEFVGYLEEYLPTMVKLIGDLAAKNGGVAPSKGAEEASEEDVRTLLRILTEAFQKNKLGTQLPSVVIKSGLYAAIRWNRRQYKGNDLHDFGHASAALYYCDYFATDKGLSHLITNELKYDQKYDVIVVSEPSAFLRHIKQI
jgi:hypothetical protein